MEQLSFGIKGNTLSENVADSLKTIISDVCQNQNIDIKYLSIEKLKQGYSVWILDPLAYESTGEKVKSDRCLNILRIQSPKISRIEIEYLYQRKDCIPKPADAVEKIYKSSVTDKTTGVTSIKKTFCHQFALDSESVIPYITAIIDYSLRNYQPSENFSCCGKYIDCSNERKCLHANKFYARCCYYKKNLESGKIFYGKNKNI